jgi:hypothetical protein
MKIFKELKKLGYKHYTEHTVEELDNLPLESKKRIMEQALVLRWFRENYSAHYIVCKNIQIYGYGYREVIQIPYMEEDINNMFKTYEEAELECLKKLIELVKNK